MLLVFLALAAAEPALVATARGHDAPRRATPLLHLRASRQEAPTAGDLQVGTEAGKANVVSGFEVVNSWLSGDDLASSVPATDRATQFYLQPTGGPLQLARAAVEPVSSPHLRTHLEGQLAKDLELQGQANLRPEKAYLLSIAYDCLSQGDASLTLTLEFEGMPSLQIPFTKTCGGERNTALTVAVGSAEDSEKVAVMGTPKWDELKVVDLGQKSTVFTVSVDPLSEKGAQVISTPVATSTGACAAQSLTPKTGKFKQKNLAAGESVDVEVEYRCFRHGSCIVSLEVPFFPDMAPYQPLRWSWTKLCGGKALGIDVELPETGPAYAGVEFLRRGIPSTPATPWIVKSNMTEHKVRLVNDKMRSLESEVKVRGLTVRCLDEKRCTSRILESTPAMLMAGSPIDLHVEYECKSSGNSLVQLMLDTDGHDPVIATWAKDCGGPFSNCSEQIFLGFIMFMLISCAFLASPAAASVFVDLFALDGKGQRRKLNEEGEFLEEEHLTPEEMSSLDRYEAYYGMQKGAVSIEQVKDSRGWEGGGRGWQGKSRASPPLPPPSDLPPNDAFMTDAFMVDAT